MVRRLTDDQLRERVWEILRTQLGPVDAMRFLSMTRSQPRDYQAWRERNLVSIDPEALIDALTSADSASAPRTG
jgi:hypothetical protein